MFGATVSVCQGTRMARLLNNMKIHELAAYCEAHEISLVIEDGLITAFEPCLLCQEDGVAYA